MPTIAPLLVLAGAFLLFLAVLFGPSAWRRARRERVLAQPFPAAWRHILRRRVPYVHRLPPDLQLQLKKLIQLFIAEKAFVGCRGLEITDEVRVTIAAQASLLLLNRGGAGYADLHRVLVYPSAFIVDRVQPQGGGVLQDQRQVLAGESWSQGQVILSWDDVLECAATPDDGRNVVIHEFAHQLDQAHGPANGAPWLGAGRSYAQWSAVLGDAFARLQAQVAWGESTLIGAYGATSPAEFFAVVSEVFFEQAGALATEQPALYAELSRFYRVDPRAWA